MLVVNSHNKAEAVDQLPNLEKPREFQQGSGNFQIVKPLALGSILPPPHVASVRIIIS